MSVGGQFGCGGRVADVPVYGELGGGKDAVLELVGIEWLVNGRLVDRGIVRAVLVVMCSFMVGLWDVTSAVRGAPADEFRQHGARQSGAHQQRGCVSSEDVDGELVNMELSDGKSIVQGICASGSFVDADIDRGGFDSADRPCTSLWTEHAEVGSGDYPSTKECIEWLWVSQALMTFLKVFAVASEESLGSRTSRKERETFYASPDQQLWWCRSWDISQ